MFHWKEEHVQCTIVSYGAAIVLGLNGSWYNVCIIFKEKNFVLHTGKWVPVYCGTPNIVVLHGFYGHLIFPQILAVK